MAIGGGAFSSYILLRMGMLRFHGQIERSDIPLMRSKLDKLGHVESSVKNVFV